MRVRAADASLVRAIVEGRPAKALRVLLVQSHSRGGVVSIDPYVDDEGESIGHKPPLGLLSVATAVRELGGHVVKVLDCLAQNLSDPEVLTAVAEFRPHIVGISAWTDYWWPASSLGRAIKDAHPGVFLVYGGPHVGVFPQETLDMPFVDAVVCGDGEIPMLALCNALAEGREPPDCPGLHARGTEVRRDASMFFILPDLDILPIPDRTLLPLDVYGSSVATEDRVTTMVTSRGCPYHCNYCKLHFQKPQYRSAREVVREFKAVAALGIREIEVYDDTFTWSKKRVQEICHGILEAGLTLRWAIRDRVNMADRETLALLRKAGCRRVNFGIESGVDRVLERIGKNITVAQAERAVRLAREAGMEVLTFFMLGNIDEQRQDMERTIAFALSLDADYAMFSVTIPYPGTPLYAEALERGIIPRDFWREHALRPERDFVIPHFIEDILTLEELIQLRNTAFRRFYLRPRYVLRQLRSVRGVGEILRKAGLAFRLFYGQIVSRIEKSRGAGRK